jgi:hypothetical protein
MTGFAAYGMLLLAACLEAGGDAVIRLGLRSDGGVARIGLFLAGAAVLLLYGLAVNARPGISDDCWASTSPCSLSWRRC